MATLLSGLYQQTTPKVFVSYHHAGDQYWYNQFSSLFHDRFEIITDNSLDREIESTNTSYLRRAIREQNITGTSVTIVLCGRETMKRRWVDWEINMTLNKEHGLLGIALPEPYHAKGSDGGCVVPDRFFKNYQSGFAHWINWSNDPTTVYNAIMEARKRSSNTGLIRNSDPLMQRSKP
jgi:hypothetical protein